MEERTVARVRVDRLEKTKCDPDVYSEDVQRLRDIAIKKRTANSANPEDEHLCRVSVLSRKTKGRRILVVDLVDVFVEGAVVKKAVSKVVVRILDEEKYDDLA